ncbi:hypothetical protein ABGB07_44835 [Micromonosporaceae bacterium B7E4]
MRSNDLAPLLAAAPSAGVDLRQGVVLAWNPVTAQNVVQVGGTTMTDLPILNTSEALLLAPGAVVGILAAASTWFILGRVTVPGTPEAASALSMVSSRIIAVVDPGLGSRSSATFGDLAGAAVGPSVTATISASGKALAFWSCGYGGSVGGTWEAHSTAGVSVAVSGATTVAASGDYSLGHNIQFPADPNPGNALTYSSFQNGMHHLFEGLNPGANTFTMKYRNLAGIDTEFDTREIAVFAL